MSTVGRLSLELRIEGSANGALPNAPEEAASPGDASPWSVSSELSDKRPQAGAESKSSPWGASEPRDFGAGAAGTFILTKIV
ncbi:hypothetical protein GCM10023081_25900 [Arthrobacter ginkgonis]|uniref:Uncharacterized protein n=1 Tax=Arthrobacter ginkgonis TaxID=1630594 RepID=A0ABP7CCK0_9MICC